MSRRRLPWPVMNLCGRLNEMDVFGKHCFALNCEEIVATDGDIDELEIRAAYANVEHTTQV